MAQKQYVGGGWHIYHLTDRSIELRKPDPAYWAITKADGFVRLRVEPGTPRADMIELAIRAAEKTDAELARRIESQMIPSVAELERYRNQDMAPMEIVFGTPEDESQIGRKRV